MIEELRLQIQIAAKPATVFRFFQDPERFRAWMGSGSNIDPQASGALSVAYPNGDVALGVVDSAEPNKSIVFTWGYKDNAHGMAPGSSVVSIELEENTAGTKVTLKHRGLDPAQRASHATGWRYYLAQLSAHAATADLGGVVEDTLLSYFAAWGERDASKRYELIASCFSESGTFTDQMGYAEGRSALSEYIGAAQKFAGDMTLEMAGPSIRVHGHLLFPWKMVAPNGQVAATGQNYASVDATGRILNIVGFWTL